MPPRPRQCTVVRANLLHAGAVQSLRELRTEAKKKNKVQHVTILPKS